MAEWLTHVFFAYALFTVAGWFIEWLGNRWIAVGVVGSILPDLNRIELVVPAEFIEALLGVPFDWNGIHTLGGLVLLCAVGAFLFERRHEQWRAFGLLFAGGLSHILVDIPQRYVDGETLTNLYFFPISSWRTATPGWYVSADRWVVVVAFVVAVVVFLVDGWFQNYWRHIS